MNLAQRLRDSRSKHLLTSYEAAVKQFRVFKEVLPITKKNSPSSGTMPEKKTSSSQPRRQS